MPHPKIDYTPTRCKYLACKKKFEENLKFLLTPEDLELFTLMKGSFDLCTNKMAKDIDAFLIRNVFTPNPSRYDQYQWKGGRTIR